MRKGKGSKMTVSIWGLIGILVIMIWPLVSATQAGEQTVKYKATTYLIKAEWAAVPDVEGHVVGLYHRRGVAIFENEVAAYSTRGTFDFIKGQGQFHGYAQCIYKDGSTTVTEYQGTMTRAPGEKLSSFKGEGKYIKGTGRFEGIKGKISLAGKYITPYTKDKTKGDTYIDYTATYTVPSK